ncbi:hypothetical protein B0H16DRAFT_1738008 [Mycena metata]|uniref:Nephrocystin 3-like N-terminal domain-containing protein n=1 Tax=Mycena metata TaxID=1033252 RepID=A0AAD7HK59_9AGAR|nr:hypothetical protein B0H16DRAFT_1738008 [Mycena metata]
MFSGAQVNGGNFYNVGGDINVHSYTHQYFALHGASAPPGLEHRNDGESRRPLAIEDRGGDPMPQPGFGGDIGGGTTERTLAGATRHPRRHAAIGPYDRASRSRHPTNSEKEGFPESSSSNYLPMGYPDTEPRGSPPQNPAHTPNSLDAILKHALKCWTICIIGAPNTTPSIQSSWLHGPAGAGKSAIMQTLSRRLQGVGRLGGAFFFKRHHPTRGNAKVLFTTLGYQLALNNPELEPLISTSVKMDPSIVAREMNIQLHKLIIEPCQSLTNSRPAILLLDGLDECQDERTQQEILRLIGNAVAQCPTGIRVIVASRPETHIRETMEESLFDGLINSINVEQSFDDVRTYLRDEFARIHSKHRDTMANIPCPWPSPEILDNLVEKSSGYFVYVSTVIKFVDDPYFRPTERLEIIQNLKPTQYDAPFEALDKLYRQILSGVRPQFYSRLLCILQCITSDFILGSAQIDYILGLAPGDTKLILRALHSVIDIQTNDERMSFHHASFLDFLRAPERSLSFHLGMENRMKVARAVLTAASDEFIPRPKHSDPWVTRFLSLYIPSVPRSPELVPFIQKISLDFIWMDQNKSPYQSSGVTAAVLQVVTSFLTWLKAIDPPPETLIQCWNTYHLAALWEAMPVQSVISSTQSLLSLSPEMLRKLQTKMARFLPLPLAKYQQLAVQFPRCTRILQGMWLLDGCNDRVGGLGLSHIRVLLDESWDEIMNTISLLHTTTYTADKPFSAIAAAMITILAHSLELHPTSASTLFCDLACNSFHLAARGAKYNHISGHTGESSSDTPHNQTPNFCTCFKSLILRGVIFPST